MELGIQPLTFKISLNDVGLQSTQKEIEWTGWGLNKILISYSWYPLDRWSWFKKKWLRSWVQLPPGPFLTVVQLWYYFEFKKPVEREYFINKINSALNRSTPSF
jgi:hypothetical protein